jgi:hypothetical protein
MLVIPTHHKFGHILYVCSSTSGLFFCWNTIKNAAPTALSSTEITAPRISAIAIAKVSPKPFPLELRLLSVLTNRLKMRSQVNRRAFGTVQKCVLNQIGKELHQYAGVTLNARRRCGPSLSWLRRQ